MNGFDDAVAKKIAELRSEKAEAARKQDEQLLQKREKYADLAELLQSALNDRPFEVYATQVAQETEEDWDYEHVIPDEGLCVVIQWRESDEEVGLVGFDSKGLLFEPRLDIDISPYLEILSGHQPEEFVDRLRQSLIEALAQFALKDEA